MEAAIRMVLRPRTTKPVAHLLGDTTDAYLRKCKQNIEAEVWALVSSGGRQTVRAVVRDGGLASVSSAAGVMIPVEQLRSCLIILNGVLSLVTRARVDRLMGF